MERQLISIGSISNGVEMYTVTAKIEYYFMHWTQCISRHDAQASTIAYRMRRQMKCIDR